MKTDFTPRPSRLDQLELCPGSGRMQAGLPDEESEYAAEGRLLHEAVATDCTTGLNLEQAGAVEGCREVLAGLICEEEEPFFEREVTVKGLDGRPIMKGTADAVIVCGDIHRPEAVTVVDWKFGRNPVPPPGRNLQIAAYALALAQQYRVGSVNAVIFQPRVSRTPAEHTFGDFFGLIDRIQTTIDRATGPDLILRASVEACRYCRARLFCPAYWDEVNQAYNASLLGCEMDTPEKVVEQYKRSQCIKGWQADVEAALRQIIERDGTCGPYTSKETRGRRELRDIPAVFARLRDELTPDEFHACCTASIGKLEDTVCQHWRAQAAAAGQKLTVADAKRRLADTLQGLIAHGTPTRRIVEAGEQGQEVEE